jgi:hypothetical protein
MKLTNAEFRNSPEVEATRRRRQDDDVSTSLLPSRAACPRSRRLLLAPSLPAGHMQSLSFQWRHCVVLCGLTGQESIVGGGGIDARGEASQQEVDAWGASQEESPGHWAWAVAPFCRGANGACASTPHSKTRCCIRSNHTAADATRLWRGRRSCGAGSHPATCWRTCRARILLSSPCPSFRCAGARGPRNRVALRMPWGTRGRARRHAPCCGARSCAWRGGCSPGSGRSRRCKGTHLCGLAGSCPQSRRRGAARGPR